MLVDTRDLLHPIAGSGFRDPKTGMGLLPNCLDPILARPAGKQRFGNTLLAMTKAFALCGSLDEATERSDAEVAVYDTLANNQSPANLMGDSELALPSGACDLKPLQKQTKGGRGMGTHGFSRGSEASLD